MLQICAKASPAPKGLLSLGTVVFLVWIFLWSGLAHAQSAKPSPVAAPPAPVPLTESAAEVLPKTVTFGLISAAFDVAIGSFITGALVPGTAMAAVASTTGWALYQVHEMAWESFGPADQTLETKTASFTALNTLRLFGVGMLFTQDVTLSLGFVVLDAVAEFGSYVVTDQLWSKVVAPAMGTPSH